MYVYNALFSPGGIRSPLRSLMKAKYSELSSGQRFTIDGRCKLAILITTRVPPPCSRKTAPNATCMSIPYAPDMLPQGTRDVSVWLEPREYISFSSF